MSIPAGAGGRVSRCIEAARASAFVILLSVAVVAAGVPRTAEAQAGQPYPPSQTYPPATTYPAPTYPSGYPAGYPGAAPSSEASAAMAQAEVDAKAEVNGTLWLAAGCLIGVLGVVLGYVVEPSPPPARFLGKSPDYVAAYSRAYAHAGKREQGSKALTGCLVGTLVVGVVYAVVIASATTTTTY